MQEPKWIVVTYNQHLQLKYGTHFPFNVESGDRLVMAHKDGRVEEMEEEN